MTHAHCHAQHRVDVEPMDIELFRRSVKELMRESLDDGALKPRVFGNKGPQHARIVIDEMLANTSREFVTFCGLMSADVYSEQSILSFLRRPGAIMRVIVESSEALKSPDSVLSRLPKDALSKIEIYYGNFDHKALHFSVCDARDVRLETDSKTREAIVRFGDSKFAREAVNHFSNLAKSGEKLE